MFRSLARNVRAIRATLRDTTACPDGHDMCVPCVGCEEYASRRTHTYPGDLCESCWQEVLLADHDAYDPESAYEDEVRARWHRAYDESHYGY